MFDKLPESVTIVEVGPRDGLQNEATVISLTNKVDLINALAECGLKKIEAASFVSPKWVPQMANSEQVMQQINRRSGVIYSALTPNLRGFDDALKAELDEVAVFAAASETFSQKNINCSIEESLERFKPIISSAKAHKIPVRGYLSCVLGCPYEGEIAVDDVVNLAKRLIDMGCYQVSLGDTIGVGTATKVAQLIDQCLTVIPTQQLAVHFHDTYGQALANVLVALQQGIHFIDASVAGLGGCPYAKGASGNLATEDLVYMLDNMGIHSGVDLNNLVTTGMQICNVLGRSNGSKVAQAIFPHQGCQPSK